jgi:hypothetical protein
VSGIEERYEIHDNGSPREDEGAIDSEQIASSKQKKVERITHPILFTVYFCAICIKQRFDFSFAGNIAINTCKKPSRNTMQLLFAPTLRSVERTGAK